MGRVDRLGPGAGGIAVGQRVGIPWLGHTCGACSYCAAGRDNLCYAPLFTGYTRDGGFATHAVANAGYARLLEELLLTRFFTAPAMPSSACSAALRTSAG